MLSTINAKKITYNMEKEKHYQKLAFQNKPLEMCRPYKDECIEMNTGSIFKSLL